jgi:hypothetical protein
MATTHLGGKLTIIAKRTTVPRELTDPGLFDTLKFRVMTDDGMDQDTAEAPRYEEAIGATAVGMKPEPADHDLRPDY